MEQAASRIHHLPVERASSAQSHRVERRHIIWFVFCILLTVVATTLTIYYNLTYISTDAKADVFTTISTRFLESSNEPIK